MNVSEIVIWLNNNAGLVVLTGFSLLGLAKVVTKWTATPKDDEIVSRVETVVESGVSKIESLLKKDLNNNGKIGE